MRQHPLKAVGLFLVFLTALCWGPNFLFIKVAVAEIPPVTLVFLRVGIGALTLVLVCLMRRINLWHYRTHWKNFFFMGLFMNIIPYTLICAGEVYISSALAGILNSLAVIFIAVMSHFFGPHDPLTRSRILGILSGVLGLLIIYFPLLMHESLGSALGSLMLVLSGLSYGIGSVYVRTHLLKMPSLPAVTCQSIVSAFLLFFLALIIDRPSHLAMPSADAIYSTILLGAIGTGISFIFYYKAIQLVGATYATLSVFLVAIFAMVLGAIFLHEKITWNLYVGTFFILLGLLTVNPVFQQSSK